MYKRQHLHPVAAEKMLNVGGRMFAVVGELPIMQATLTQRASEGASSHETLFETCLPPLINAPQANKFEMCIRDSISSEFLLGWRLLPGGRRG